MFRPIQHGQCCQLGPWKGADASQRTCLPSSSELGVEPHMHPGCCAADRGGPSCVLCECACKSTEISHLCVQIEEAKARLDQRKGDMQSLEAEVQRANERAKELKEEARKAR